MNRYGRSLSAGAAFPLLLSFSRVPRRPETKAGRGITSSRVLMFCFFLLVVLSSFRRIQIGGQTAIDQDFLPTVTASCQGGQMTIRVETRQSFQGKREKPVRRIPKTRSRPALRKRMVASVFFNRIRPRLHTSRTWVESSVVNLVRSYSCSPF